MKDKIAVIGLGYVGLPLALEFSKKFQVLGYDINPKRINQLNSYIDKTNQVDSNNLQDALDANLSLSYKEESLKNYNI